jgi:hypothetical protein
MVNFNRLNRESVNWRRAVLRFRRP